MNSYLIYSICRPLKVIARIGHKIMLNFLKKKDLLTQTNIDGKEHGKQIYFKDGLRGYVMVD